MAEGLDSSRAGRTRPVVMKTLSPAAVAQYRRDGFDFLPRVLSPEEAAGYRARLEAVERERGGPLGGALRHKGHLLFTWLDELIRHPRVLDAVEDILGPNLLCWSLSSSSRRPAIRPSRPGTRTRPPGPSRTW